MFELQGKYGTAKVFVDAADQASVSQVVSQVVSVEAYEARLIHERIRREIAISEAQIEEGKMRDAGESLDALRKRYGL